MILLIIIGLQIRSDEEEAALGLRERKTEIVTKSEIETRIGTRTETVTRIEKGGGDRGRLENVRGGRGGRVGPGQGTGAQRRK